MLLREGTKAHHIPVRPRVYTLCTDLFRLLYALRHDNCASERAFSMARLYLALWSGGRSIWDRWVLLPA